MRKIVYALLAAAVLVCPVERLDVAKLLPVEAVAVYYEGDRIVLETDSENQGRGKTVDEALADLRENTIPVIYLDTAAYLLVGEGADAPATELRKYLRRNVRIGAYQGGDVKEEAKYLDAHSSSAKPNINN